MKFKEISTFRWRSSTFSTLSSTFSQRSSTFPRCSSTFLDVPRRPSTFLDVSSEFPRRSSTFLDVSSTFLDVSSAFQDISWTFLEDPPKFESLNPWSKPERVPNFTNCTTSIDFWWNQRIWIEIWRIDLFSAVSTMKWINCGINHSVLNTTLSEMTSFFEFVYTFLVFTILLSILMRPSMNSLFFLEHLCKILKTWRGMFVWFAKYVETNFSRLITQTKQRTSCFLCATFHKVDNFFSPSLKESELDPFIVKVSVGFQAHLQNLWQEFLKHHSLPFDIPI